MQSYQNGGGCLVAEYLVERASIEPPLGLPICIGFLDTYLPFDCLIILPMLLALASMQYILTLKIIFDPV